MTSETKPRCAPAADQSADIGDTICRAVDDLAHVSAPVSVWSLMRGFALGFGWQRMIALDAQDQAASQTFDDAEAGDRKAEWQVILAALRGLTPTKPFLAAELALTEGGKPLAALLESAGLGDALVVPVVRLLEFKGAIVFAKRLDSFPDLSPITRSALHVLAHCAFDRVHALEHEPRRKEAALLSPREAECLRWAANGKTDNEIGAILAISPRTARFHIENAKKKLGVSTRIQAVAEALRLKAIAA